MSSDFDYTEILFVDDDPDILNAATRLISTLPNVKAHGASSGEEALEFLSNHWIDVLISDYHLPGMHGLELLRTAQIASPWSVRLLATGYPDLSMATRAINEGQVYGFIEKPIEAEALLNSLTTIISQRGSTWELFKQQAFEHALKLVRRGE